MEKIHIGLMLPLSTILPISKDFETGLKKGLAEANTANLEIEITKEFIAQGSTAKVEAALAKLVNFDEVDILTGIVSNRVVEDLNAKIGTYNKPIIVNNAGGFIPDLNAMNNLMFLNATHLWQHAWALGYWGVKNIGKKGMYVAAVYDAGYSFSHMFYEGMKAAGAADEDWSFVIAPLPNPSALSDIATAIGLIEQHQPDFIFATFCGEETTLFLNAFIEAGLHKKVKLMGLPFLLAPFKPVTADISIITTAITSNETAFEVEKSFYYLGYKTGIEIAKAAIASNGTDLLDQLYKSPHFFSLKNLGDENIPLYENNTINILVANLFANSETVQQTQIGNSITLSLNNETVKNILSNHSSWQNPYLCI